MTIHFTHYHSEAEALEKWKIRSKRIDRDNLFICCLERDGMTRDDILKLQKVKACGIVVFTANNYPDIPYTCHVPDFTENGEVVNLLNVSRFDDYRRYEEVFDFVKWFNEADGRDYKVTNFHR